MLDRYKTQNTVKMKEEQRIEVDKAEDHCHLRQGEVSGTSLMSDICWINNSD